MESESLTRHRESLQLHDASLGDSVEKRSVNSGCPSFGDDLSKDTISIPNAHDAVKPLASSVVCCKPEVSFEVGVDGKVNTIVHDQM